MSSFVIARLVFLVIFVWGGRAVWRRRMQEKEDLRLTRDRDQAALFRRELPPKPTYVASNIARVACASCGELVEIDRLVTCENAGRICDVCDEALQPSSAGTYRS